MHLRKAVSCFLFLIFVGIASPASAGELVEAAEEVEEVIEQVGEKVKELMTPVIRQIQAFVVAAHDAVSRGDQKSARSLALAARYELRKVPGVKLEPLTARQLADKADTSSPYYKKALKNMPAASVLLLSGCNAPNYAVSCCPAGGKPCDGACCASGQTCQAKQCKAKAK